MRELVTTALDVLALLLVAAGLAVLLTTSVGLWLGLLVAGVIVALGSAAATRPPARKEDG